ncbi:MAG: class I SAM-dependent methyltransferase [Candidatus Dormibacteraeota bacterium]|nr:class I SAM-dependent methyltransferase [Candidatus Dormibacteraeota bacterium]
MTAPFAGTQHLYDAVYSWKDYPAEVERLRPYLRGSTILDVACGTGGHIQHLSGAYEVVGVDIDPGMLEVAREKNPGVELKVADMRDFELGRRFGTVLCLFSSIGYLGSVAELNSALACFARHSEEGGAVLVEPWLRREKFELQPPRLFSHEADGSTVARMGLVEVDGEFTNIRFHYLIGSPGRIEHVEEVHRTRLFSDAEYRAAFEAAGLAVGYDEGGPMGRGLYFGSRP